MLYQHQGNIVAYLEFGTQILLLSISTSICMENQYCIALNIQGD